MPRRFFLAGLLLVLSATRAAAQDAPLAEVDRIFEWANASGPGCAVAVGKDGVPVVERAYGLANLEYDVANTPATVFEAGSVSKQFTAAAVVLLALDGKLSLDDPIRRHIPELPNLADGITVRHMLNHTSGFRDWGSVVAMGGWPRGSKTYTNAHALDVTTRQSALNHAPGAEYIYSNTNYNLAAILVERLAGKSFAAFTKERLFTPLGMTSTEWRDDYNRIVKRRATAYSPAREGFRQNMPFENVHGNGGLLTTVGDLLKWNEALAKGTIAEGRLTRELETRGLLTGGRPIDYALGLEHGEHRGAAEIAHGGATAGYRAFLARYPEPRLSVALLCNSASANPTRLARAVAALWLPAPAASTGDAPAPASLSTGQLDRHAGTYRHPLTGEPWRIERRGTALVVLGGGPLSALDSTTFTGGGMRMRFSAAGLNVVSGTDTTHWERAIAWAPTPTDVAALTGRYVSAEAMGEQQVVERDGALVLRLGVGAETRLLPAYEDAFLAPGVGYVQLERDAAGGVKALLVSSDRARRVRFERVR